MTAFLYYNPTPPPKKMNNQIKSSGNQYDSPENALVGVLSHGDGHQYEVIEIRIKWIN